MAVEQLIWDGIVNGSVYAVAALGLTIIFGILNFFNVAYGEYIALSGYIMYAVYVEHKLALVFAAILAIVGGISIALGSNKVLFQHFRDRSPTTVLVVSMGLSFIFQNIIRIVWGSTAVTAYSSSNSYTIAGIQLLPSQIAIIVISLAVLALTFTVLRRTWIGIAMRAASNDRTLTQIRGVDTERLVMYVWLTAGFAGGTAGLMYAMNSVLRPLTGLHLLVVLFAALVIGGVGNPLGAVIGGYVIGVIQELSLIFLSPEYKVMIAMVVLIAALLIIPDGLFTEGTR